MRPRAPRRTAATFACRSDVGRVIRIAALAGFALAIALGAGELALRIAGVRPPGAFTNLRYENDPMTGPWLMPSQVGFHQTPCSLSEDIHVNTLGMRDRERSTAPVGRRVAVIGDSFTQGLHVADEETVSRRLEAMLGGKAEVLNFGVSSVGTSVELLTYRARVRAFEPDVVLLMFYAGNDVSDNLPALKQRLDPAMGGVSPYLLLDAGGRLKDRPEPGQFRRTSRLVALASSSAVGQWSYRGFQGLRQRLGATGQVSAASVAPADALFEDAWRITEEATARFATEVHADGAGFALVLIPADQAETTRVTAERLQRVADARGFPLVALPAPDPASVTCHRHWDARGHAAVADTLLTLIRDQRWIE